MEVQGVCQSQHIRRVAWRGLHRAQGGLHRAQSGLSHTSTGSVADQRCAGGTQQRMVLREDGHEFKQLDNSRRGKDGLLC